MTTFYRVYDTQRNEYFATGYNATSLKELEEKFASYILMTNEVEDNEENRNGFLSNWEGIEEYLQGAVLESSPTKFEEYFYSVWVGGVEVNNYFLNKEEAENLAQKWIDDGYDEVAIDDYRITDNTSCSEENQINNN